MGSLRKKYSGSLPSPTSIVPNGLGPESPGSWNTVRLRNSVVGPVKIRGHPRVPSPESPTTSFIEQRSGLTGSNCNAGHVIEPRLLDKGCAVSSSYARILNRSCSGGPVCPEHASHARVSHIPGMPPVDDDFPIDFDLDGDAIDLDGDDIDVDGADIDLDGDAIDLDGDDIDLDGDDIDLEGDDIDLEVGDIDFEVDDIDFDIAIDPIDIDIDPRFLVFLAVTRWHPDKNSTTILQSTVALMVITIAWRCGITSVPFFFLQGRTLQSRSLGGQAFLDLSLRRENGDSCEFVSVS
eukprot:m.118442 g.118442  ORF g.118442 m.118442 type:complete len:294 (+) comp17207_c0_seq1:140-1021(+)